jgi:hypothetical protein
LLLNLEHIINKLKIKSPEKHEFYPVIMALLQSVDMTMENVH